MKTLIIIFVLSLILPGVSSAVSPDQKSKLNTHLYEKSEGENSVNGKVKAIREVQEETEVFLETKGSGGPFVLPQGLQGRAKMLKSLQKSLKPGGPPVTISIDEQQRIKSVEESESSTKAQSEWHL
ncbi:MAG TPA: hypothetical protein VIG33_08050 [Pseudobdellovibrionaceae bacterium]